MDILYYKNLNFSTISGKFFQTLEHLKTGNFAAADVKKMHQHGLYRAKLDYDSRLLFKIAKYNGQSYLLLLEVISNHDYSSSRFLRGAQIDETKLLPLQNGLGSAEKSESVAMPYVNPKKQHFHLLDKILSFDDDQEEIFHIPPPLIIIGSAGSGKTALALEKIKPLKGNILYITLSPFLAEHAAHLYYSFNYENEEQEIDFLSFREFIESISVPKGRKIDFRTFEAWYLPHRHHTGIKDAHKLFEEFKGVITGGVIEKEFLSREDYLRLGIKQSVFMEEERNTVYNLFEKYLRFMNENNYYDINIVSYRWLALCKPRYDFAIVDEVQDITNIQLFLILQSLSQKERFILCGDSNQIVHPNFFSWSKIKTMFYLNQPHGNITRLLTANYRNSPQVTELSNKLLKIKNARFGSIDKESNYLIRTIPGIQGEREGEVAFLEDNASVKNEFNQKTLKSARFAVLVMRNEDKAEARKFFSTPLLFSVQEAKGLEYENILLYNFITGNDKEFREITSGVSIDALQPDDLHYARAADKTDKSLEVYKFFINSLYVAITRAVRNVYIIEQNSKHEILVLLGLINVRQKLDMQQQTSSLDEWQREAQRLEKQGRTEQSELIRKTILGTMPVPWKVITPDELNNLRNEAFHPEIFNKKAKDKLFDYALIYNDTEIMRQLVLNKYRRAERYESERGSLLRRVYLVFANDDVKRMMAEVKKYGVDYKDEFNLTPLMAAVRAGAINISNYLLAIGAKTELTDIFGKNVLQTALFQSYFSKEFSKNKLGKIYPIIVTDSIRVKTDNRLVKIGNHKSEYLLLNLLIAVQKEMIKRKGTFETNGFTIDDFVNTLAEYPDSVLPDYRKKRGYISAVLARNEISRKEPYNKNLFLRLERGYYVINPQLEVQIRQVAEDWINVYDLMRTEKMNKEKDKEIKKTAMEDRVKDLLEEQKKMQKVLATEARYMDRESINTSRRYLNDINKDINAITNEIMAMEKENSG